ncbi:MAG TPA: tRNA uridine-5-carboxymethylaminomethyl(34) synthesis GTPase MnmE [bacterium]|nr:tRNA uridine-5-carboxymethylaminomethyl(34) synthesis GTPase MnmE [bacterium]
MNRKIMINDTICALSTPYGISGIGIIRMSGPDTIQIIDKIFTPGRKRKTKKTWETHTVRYGFIVDDGKTVDEVLVTIMKSPASYTREDMAEIGCHGGLAAIKSVLRICMKEGARLAEPGEFTRRAFLNGRIDLTQAEGILDIISAKTEKSLEISVNQTKGTLSKKINTFRDKLLETLTFLDYQIDFSEDYGELHNTSITKNLIPIISDMEQTIKTGQAARIFTEGVRIAIVGKPNVGKSKLLNLLVEEDKAIVSDIPGTTRDSIEVIINIQGIPLTIVDTAGLRHSPSEIEKMGIERTKKWIEKSEIILVLIDASNHIDELDYQILNEVKNKNHIIIFNKCDLPGKVGKEDLPDFSKNSMIVKISALTGKGLSALHSAILDRIYAGAGEIKNTDFFLNIRQHYCLEKALGILKESLEITEKNGTIDIIAENIRQAVVCLDEISGRCVSEEILDRIFSKFCIGK